MISSLFGVISHHHPHAQDGRTTIMNAVIGNCPWLVKSLIEKKCHLNIRDSGGKTALMYAAIKGHKEVAQLLLDAKADCSLVDKKGENAYMQSQSSAIRLLIAKHAHAPEELIKDLDEKNQFGLCCLEEANKHMHAAITSTVEHVILESINEAVRYYDVALRYEPHDAKLIGMRNAARDFQRRLHVVCRSKSDDLQKSLATPRVEASKSNNSANGPTQLEQLNSEVSGKVQAAADKSTKFTS